MPADLVENVVSEPELAQSTRIGAAGARSARSGRAASLHQVRIDFHFGVDHRLRYACRVIRKARAAEKRAVVYTHHADRLAQFDQVLWTFSALDFVPHVYAGSPLAAATPVLLAIDAETAPDSDVLLTLDDDPPPSFEKFFPRYQRVIEVVSCDEHDRQCARARFKRYRERGFEPTAFEAR